MTHQLNRLSRWDLLRAVFNGQPLVDQAAAHEAIRVVEERVPVRQVIPSIARPPNERDIPLAYNMYLGPGRPPVPMWGQGYWNGAGVWVENIDPRSIDYPPNVNATIIPRIGYGHMSFSEIEYYAHVPPVARCRNMIIDEILSLEPQILDQEGTIVDDPDLNWLKTYPDRVTPWSSWVSRWLYNSIVFDAAATQPIYTTDGQIMALRYVEGPTIFVLVNEKGDQPAAPEPAYSQIILGTQYIWLNTNQLWYYPRHPRPNSPYGITAIEDCLTAIQLVANMLDYSLKWYTEGTSPESSMTVSPDWTIDQIKEWQTYEDQELSGNTGVRRRRRFYPNGFALIETKDIQFNDKLYDAAEAEISFMHGIPPAEFGKMPGQSLGGKGMAANKTTQFYRLAIKPNIMPLINLFNRVLRLNGYDRYHFNLVYPTDSLDPAEQHQNTIDEFEAGLIRRNEARGQLGRDRIPGPDGEYLVDPSKKGAALGQPELGTGQPVGRPSTGRMPKPSSGGIRVRGNTGAVVAHTGSTGHGSQAAAPVEGQTVRVPVRGPGGTFAGSEVVNVDTGNLVTDQVALKREDVQHDSSGGMIALYLPETAAQQLRNKIDSFSLPNDARCETSENMHVTLVAFEKLSSQNDRKILSAMQSVALQAESPVLTGTVGGWGVFTSGDEQVLYASFDCPELSVLRQALIDQLDMMGVAYLDDHGFTPHITLVYSQQGFQKLADIPLIEDIQIDGFTLAQGESSQITITFCEGFTRFGKRQVTDNAPVPLSKHCGVCEDDDRYFGMPISRAVSIEYQHQGANETEVVAITPPPELGLPSVPALWKAGKDEKPELVADIGGPQYIREEGMCLFDRAFTGDDEHLVPLAYISDLEEEGPGAVLMFSRQHTKGHEDVANSYDPEWIELAALEDAIMGQTDRSRHNWLTHPDDDRRPLLIDNGLVAPTAESQRPFASIFVEVWGSKPISDQRIAMVKLICDDQSLWTDLTSLFGKETTLLIQARAFKIRDSGVIDQSVVQQAVESSTEDPGPTSV